MNSIFSGEAQIHFGASDFTIMEPGGYVVCAVTGEQVPLERLRYWNAETQEAFKDAEASLKARLKASKEGLANSGEKASS